MPDFYRLKPPRWSSASSTSCPALAQQDSRALLVLGFVLFLFFPLFLFRRRRAIPGDVHPRGAVMSARILTRALLSLGDLFGGVGLSTPPPLLSVERRGDSNASLCMSVVRVAEVVSPYFQRLFISSACWGPAARLLLLPGTVRSLSLSASSLRLITSSQKEVTAALWTALLWQRARSLVPQATGLSRWQLWGCGTVHQRSRIPWAHTTDYATLQIATS